MRGVLEVEGVEKSHTLLGIDEDVKAIGRWDVLLPEVEYVAPFSDIVVLRGGVTIFKGRVELPKTDFDAGGSTLDLRGYDYTIVLTDYLVPSASIVDTATTAALTTLLSLTPFGLSVNSQFSYVSDPLVLDSTCEFLNFDFNDTCIEFAEVEEDEEEIDTGVNTVPDPEFRGCFWYDGATTRFYVFYASGGTVRYRFSADCGVSWSAEQDTTYVVATNHFSVAWYDSKVYLFLEDAGGNTDFYRGTITDATGLVAFALIAGNIFANWMRAGPWFAADGHIWVVEETGGNGDCWESINDGVGWNNRFTGTEVVLYMLPKSDNNMWVFEHDVANTDLELWDWIAAEAFVNKIDDLTTPGPFSGCMHADYTINIVWLETAGADQLHYGKKTEAGAWMAILHIDPAGVLVATTAWQVSADRGITAYVGALTATGFEFVTIVANVEGTWINPVAEQGPNVQAPACGLWDGELAVFFSFEGFNDDLWFWLPAPEGIRINRGQTTGWFRTDDIIAGGTFIKWGYVVADGVQLGDTVWDVQDGSDVDIITGQSVPFDLDYAGVDASETTIKLYVTMTDTGTDPYVSEIDVSERIDEVTLDLDHEDCYTGMRKWATLSGGDFWVEEAAGVFTVHVATTRGSDKSAVVTLKNAKTGLYPDVVPNIKVVDHTYDWESYANKIYMIGSGTGGSRVEVEVYNEPGVDIYGEHWISARDADLADEPMARTRAAEILLAKGTVVQRVNVEFLDDYDPATIEIGDVVMVAAEFGDDVATRINGTMRAIRLTREYGVGERVVAQLVSEIKAVEFYNRLVRISDLERWVTT